MAGYRRWDRYRWQWAKHVDRALVLEGADPDFGQVPRAALAGWRQATHRLTLGRDQGQTPYSLVAILTEQRARQLGLTLEALEEIVLSAWQRANPSYRLRSTAYCKQQAAVAASLSAPAMATNCTWTEATGDGSAMMESSIPRIGRVAPSPPTCLRALSTRRSRRTEPKAPSGCQKAGAASEVRFTFSAGRIVNIDAASGAGALLDMMDSRSGDPGRVGHIGIGLNPYLTQPVGWTLVDEHVHGYLFLALGENRYMGGQNESSLNIDYATPNPTLMVDDQIIVREGRVIV